jgi:hypothetical protein
MHCHIYLRRGTVYLPTMGRMDKGFYRGVEPVAVVAATNTEALHQALAATIGRGNPDVPTLLRREWPPPVLLKYAWVKSWSAFERGMQLWALKEKDGIFQIAGYTKQLDGMWRDDPQQTITFPPGSTVDDVIARMIAILQDAARPHA